MDEWQQALAGLQEAFVMMDTDGDGQPDTMVPANQGVVPTRSRGEMRSYQPTLGDRIRQGVNSVVGEPYGQKVQDAAEAIGITAPYNAGRAIGSGYEASSPRQMAYGAGLLALSALPGAAIGRASARRLPDAAHDVIMSADEVTKTLANRAGGPDTAAAAGVIQNALSALPTGSMVPRASMATTGTAAAIGGGVGALSTPNFDPASYQDWLRVAGGAAAGAAGERVGARVMAAPPINPNRHLLDFPSKVDATDIAAARASLNAAMKMKQTPPVRRPPSQPTPAAALPAPQPAAPQAAIASAPPASPPLQGSASATAPRSVGYGRSQQDVVRPFVDTEIMAGRVPTPDGVRNALSGANIAQPTVSNFAPKAGNTQAIVEDLMAKGVPHDVIVTILQSLRNNKTMPLLGASGAAGMGLNALSDQSYYGSP